jgi:DNA modification methylase
MYNTHMFLLYNHTSEDMSETKDESVDLILTSPPYNIGTKYSDFKDADSFEIYKKTLEKIFSECYRVLNKDGRLIIEVADTVFMKGKYVTLAALTQFICTKIGFYLEERHINFISTDNGIELLDHGWENNYTTSKDAHSNCQQFLVFTKVKKDFKDQGEILYHNYKTSPEHPCPFPQEHFDYFLSKYFKPGFTVLDPFAGTAGLGIEVLKRGGNYIGYELIKEFYEVALEKLK